MLTSIKKMTKSVLAKALIGIIMLAFVFVGTGDLFRSGNQNIIVTIDSEKITAQSFVEYVNRLNLNEQQRSNLSKTDLLDRILRDYIGKKIISLEVIDQGISLNNKSLRELLVNDETFKKDNKFPEEDVTKTYESNKSLFLQDFKKIIYVELLPDNLIGQKKYNEAYFEKIDLIENAILDGGKMNDFVNDFNLLLKTIEETNRLKKNKAGEDIANVNKELFEKIFNLKAVNKPELISVNNKYFLSEVLSVDKVSGNLENKDIREAIISQLKLKHIIESNTKIVKEMSEGVFNIEQFKKFSKDNALEISRTTLNSIENKTIFNSDIIKEIFKIDDGNLQLITNSQLTKNYIILAEKTKKVPFNKKSKDYEKYKAKAKLNLANQIYSDFDRTVNNKYDVEINENVLNRIKNTL